MAKSIKDLSIVTNPENILVGKNTSLKDILDCMAALQAGNYALALHVRLLEEKLKPVPDNVVNLSDYATSSDDAL